MDCGDVLDRYNASQEFIMYYGYFHTYQPTHTILHATAKTPKLAWDIIIDKLLNRIRRIIEFDPITETCASVTPADCNGCNQVSYCLYGASLLSIKYAEDCGDDDCRYHAGDSLADNDGYILRSIR